MAHNDWQTQPAVPDDQIQAAELVFMTFDEMADPALGFGDHARTMNVLAKYFSLRGNRFSYDACQVVKSGGQIAALLIAFTGQTLMKRSVTTVLQTGKVFGWREAPRMIHRGWGMFMSRDANTDEYYIAHLAVSPDFRRQGLAQFLLLTAEKQARAAGLTRVSLVCDWGHDAARTLYINSGYRVVQTVATPSMEAEFHLAGFERMVKDIKEDGA